MLMLSIPLELSRVDRDRMGAGGITIIRTRKNAKPLLYA